MDGLAQLPRLEGLLEDRGRPVGEEARRRVGEGAPGDEHHPAREPGIARREAGVQLHPAHLGHHEIAEHRVELLAAVDARERLGGRGGGRHGVALPERPHDRAGDERVVVHHEDAAWPNDRLARERRRLGRSGTRRERERERRRRERHAERAAPSDLRLDVDAAAGVAHDPVRDREAEPGANPERLRREEGLEDALEHVRRDPDARVAHEDRGGAVGRARGLDADEVLVRAPLRDRLRRVDEQVQEHLAELVRARLDHRQVPDPHLEARAVPDLVPRDPDRRLELRADVRRRPAALAGARERAQRADDVPDPVRGVAGVRDRAREVQPRLELAAEEVEVRRDRCERVVDLVGDARGERSEPGHPLRELELRLHRAPLGHVRHDRREAERPAVRGAPAHAPAHPDPFRPVGPGGDPVLGLEQRGLAAEVRLEPGADRGRVVRVRDPREDLLERTLDRADRRGAAERPLRDEVERAGGEVPIPDRVRAGDGEREALLRLGEPCVEGDARRVLPPREREHHSRGAEQRGAEREDDPERPPERRLHLRRRDLRLHAPGGPGDLAARDERRIAPVVEPLDEPRRAAERAHDRAVRVGERDALDPREPLRDRTPGDEQPDEVAFEQRQRSGGGLARHRPALEDVLEHRRGVRAEEEHVRRGARRADRDHDVEIRPVAGIEPQLGGGAVRGRDRPPQHLG